MNSPRVKPAHNGVSALEYGDPVFLVVRHDDKVIDVQPTRHAARGVVMEYNRDTADTFRTVPRPAGGVRMEDHRSLWK